MDCIVRGSVAAEGAALIPSDADGLRAACKQLLDSLNVVCRYVDAVVSGSLEGDSAIGKQLSDALALVPRLSSSTFESMFSGTSNDLLMVAYLAQLARAQALVAEKLSMA